jgi:hypothetical protein
MRSYAALRVQGCVTNFRLGYRYSLELIAYVQCRYRNTNVFRPHQRIEFCPTIQHYSRWRVDTNYRGLKSRSKQARQVGYLRLLPICEFKPSNYFTDTSIDYPIILCTNPVLPAIKLARACAIWIMESNNNLLHVQTVI